MNRAFDCGNYKDFRSMCSLGEICPNRAIQIANETGTNIQNVPFLEQAVVICKKEDTDLLSLLSDHHSHVNRNLRSISHNVPTFGSKVQAVIDEWPYELTVDELFQVPEKVKTFNYSDAIQCNQMVKDLGSGMLHLEKCVSEDDDNLYDEIRKMQSDCIDCSTEIDKNLGLLTSISEEYDPRLYSILMDLSTRQKPFFIECDDDDKLLSLARSKTCKEIPDKVSDLFLNSVFIPNMIQKEVEYNKNILETLKKDVREKQMILSELKGRVPEKKSSFQVQNPIESFLRLLVRDEPQEDEGPEGEGPEGEGPFTQGPSGEGQSMGAEILDVGKLSSSREDEINKALNELDREDDQDLSSEVSEVSEVSELSDLTDLSEIPKQSVKQGGGNYELSFY